MWEAEKCYISSMTKIELLCMDERNEKLREHKSAAITVTYRQMLFYIERGYMLSLIKSAYQKKLDAIREATSKGELDTIIHSPKPIRFGGEYVDSRQYAFDEEELMQWCLWSLQYVPHNAEYKRIDVLFKRIFGKSIEEL